MPRKWRTFWPGSVAFLTVVSITGCLSDFGGGISIEAQEQELLGNVAGFDNTSPFPQKTVYLTFDDGPGWYTGAFLDLLKEKNVRATFFVNANNLYDVSREPALQAALLRIVREGHDLGNHTVDHPNFSGTTKASWVADELDENEVRFNNLLRANGEDPVTMSLFRNPFGAQSAVANATIARRALIMLWSVDSSDSLDWAADNGVRCEWHIPPWNRHAPACVAKIQRIKDRVLSGVRARGGGVVLMHDIHPTSWAALPEIIDTLRAEGYSFDTLEGWSMSASGYSAPSAMASNCSETTVTGFRTCGRIKLYWSENGGLPVFGYPKRPASVAINKADGFTYWTQWFERNRLEIHPENRPPYNVLLGLLGVERLQQMGVDWRTAFPREQPQPGCLYFAETGHNVCDQGNGIGFKTYWLQHGLNGIADDYANSLALFGYPISDAHVETVTLDGGSTWTGVVQWFERARFEWHPEISDSNYKVLLGLLGNELLKNLPADPCSARQDGHYCGGSLAFGGVGASGRLYRCFQGTTIALRKCASGCEVRRPNQPDRCQM